MNIKVINFLYWLVTTLDLIFMKIITHTYNIDNVIFNSVFKCIMLPYYIYELVKINKTQKIVANWYDILNGVLDQVDLIFGYIAFYGLTIGEYITYKTFSIVLGSIYLIIYNKKLLSLQKMIGISFIFLACCILLGFYNKSNFFYSLMCLGSALAYSFSGFIIELNVKTDEERKLNFYWVKTISYIIALFLGLTCEFTYNTITNILKSFSTKNILIIIFLEIVMALLENYYYYFKVHSISKQPKYGSIVIQFLDIMRRFTMIIIGVLFFKEIYSSVIYLSTTLMFIGSLIGLIDSEKVLYFYHKYYKKETFDENNYKIELTNLDGNNIKIVCDNK